MRRISSRSTASSATAWHSRSLAVDRRVASRRVQRGEQQAARARRGDEPQRAVDGGLVQAPAATEVEHRRLGQAAGVLVRARDDEVRAGGQGVLRKRVAEGQVRAPRLVDDERHAVGVRDAARPATSAAAPK